jgi:hypothetical protein
MDESINSLINKYEDDAEGYVMALLELGYSLESSIEGDVTIVTAYLNNCLKQALFLYGDNLVVVRVEK